MTPCRICGQEIPPNEAKAYNSRCESCWCLRLTKPLARWPTDAEVRAGIEGDAHDKAIGKKG
jgi:hypothetical protein